METDEKTLSVQEQLAERDRIIAGQRLELDRLTNGIKDIAYSGRTKGGMKQSALQLLGLFPR